MPARDMNVAGDAGWGVAKRSRERREAVNTGAWQPHVFAPRVLSLCGDFDIAPSLVDADAILSLYRVVEKQKKARGLAYAQFLDLLALVARAALLDELATDAACVNALLFRWGLADPVRLEGLRRG